MLSERAFTMLAIAIAVVFLSFGVFMALQSGKSEWLNRSGAGIVATEIVIVIAEHRRRYRLESVRRRYEYENPFIEHEIRRAENQLNYLGMILIVFGELVHGYGDVVFEAVRSFE